MRSAPISAYLPDPAAGSTRPSPIPPSSAARCDRRRRDARNREFAERITEMAPALPEDERALLQSIFEQGLTIATIAAMHRVSAQAARRRISRLIARVLSPRFEFAVRHAGELPLAHRAVAEACIVRGLSMRRASEDLDMSIHAVRRSCDALDALFESHRLVVRRRKSAGLDLACTPLRRG